MKLAFRRLDLELAHTWRIATSHAAGTNLYPTVLIELSDANGARGLGEAASTLRYQQPPEIIEAFLRRVDPAHLCFADIPASMQYLDRLAPGHDAAKCGLNIALLDGASRAAGKSVHEFLELPFLEGRHLTSFSIGIDTPEVVRAKVEQASAYPVLKLKVGSPQDAEIFTALREVAPERTVRVDANEAWKTKEEALRQIEWLSRDGHVEFIEQPMPAAAPLADWVWLKERSPIPVFMDESYHHAQDVDQAAEGAHGVNVKLVKAGGITGAQAALVAARKAGLKTMIGCMIETSVLISAAAHLASLADHLDLDGNLLIRNDPYTGATVQQGRLSFATAKEKLGLRAQAIADFKFPISSC